MAAAKAKRTREAVARAEWAQLMGEPLAMLACPPKAKDPKGLIEHGLAIMIRVSYSEDQEIAMQAAKWLVSYGEAVAREIKPAKTADKADDLLANLRGLYAKALKASPDLVVEATSETLERTEGV